MEVALIPPVAHMGACTKTNYQLMLPQLVSTPGYSTWMNELERRGDYIILDNGAAEAERVENNLLIAVARLFSVSELALPDALGDAAGTLNLMQQFFEDYHEQDSPLDCAFGFVAQGRDQKQAMQTVNHAMENWGQSLKTVFLPRLLLNNGDVYARVALANNIHTVYPHLDIHAFGANKYWPREAIVLEREAGFIRSIDTSLPFVAALNGDRLRTTYRETDRQDNYFNQNVGVGSHIYKLMEQNVEEYIAWARGREWSIGG